MLDKDDATASSRIVVRSAPRVVPPTGDDVGRASGRRRRSVRPLNLAQGPADNHSRRPARTGRWGSGGARNRVAGSSEGREMIASLKSYSRIARILLGVLGALLIIGIIGSLLMGVRAKRNAEDMVVSQARAIADSSLSLLFTRAISPRPVSADPRDRALVADQGRRHRPERLRSGDDVLARGHGPVLDRRRAGSATSSPARRTRSRKRSRTRRRSACTRERSRSCCRSSSARASGRPPRSSSRAPTRPIASADNPWNTNAIFLFAMLFVLGLAVFGVARLLQMVAAQPAAGDLPRATAAPAPPGPRPSPQPGLREEGDARRKAEDRATAAEERLALLQDQYRKSLEELQNYRELAREPRAAGDPELEERALRAEGQVRTLEAARRHARHRAWQAQRAAPRRVARAGRRRRRSCRGARIRGVGAARRARARSDRAS